MVQYWQKIILSSWNAYKQHFGMLFGAYLIIHIFLTYPQFVVTTITLNEDLSNFAEFVVPSNIILLFAILFLSGGVWLGGLFLSYCALNNKPVIFKTLFQQFYLLPRLAVKYLVSSILGTLIFMLIKNIILSILLFFTIYTALFFFYDYLILIRQLKFMDAIKTNFYLVSENIGKVIQYGCLYFIIGLIFILLPIVVPMLAQSFLMVVGVSFFLDILNQKKIEEPE